MKSVNILCLDFDGVIHSYKSGWKGLDVIPDEPVPGAMAFICEAVKRFEVHVYSSRSAGAAGLLAMQTWMRKHMREHLMGSGEHAAADVFAADDVLSRIHWPFSKPPAFLTLDDRAWQFNGVWPSLESIGGFKPWFKQEPVIAPMTGDDFLRGAEAATSGAWQDSAAHCPAKPIAESCPPHAVPRSPAAIAEGRTNIEAEDIAAGLRVRITPVAVCLTCGHADWGRNGCNNTIIRSAPVHGGGCKGYALRIYSSALTAGRAAYEKRCTDAGYPPWDTLHVLAKTQWEAQAAEKGEDHEG